MKDKSSRRKFIATAITGTAASIIAPTVFAGEQAKQPEVTSNNMNKHDSAGKKVDTGSKRVTPSEFIIFPWGGMPNNSNSPNHPWGIWGNFDTDQDALMRDLYECGFNTSGFCEVQNLRHIRNNNLMGIILSMDITDKVTSETTQEEANETIKKLIESISNPDDRKALYAIYLRDEPNGRGIPLLKVWSEAVKKQNVIPYINLLPDIGQSEIYESPQNMSKEYKEYINQFIETCKPPYISYDNYSLHEDGRLNEDFFYGNLDTIRNKSLQAGIPFWNVILGNTHFNYAEPSDATLAIQVYSTLAYGSKGIGYFTYYNPQVGNYRLSAIDRFGNRTKTWEMVRNINLQIHSLVPVYGKLKSVNVFHTGTVPRYGQGMDSAKLVESVTGDTLLVGEFTDDEGKPYAMVVNKNMHSSIAFDLQFKAKGRMMIVSQFNRGMVNFVGEQKWLAPGNGMLLTVGE